MRALALLLIPLPVAAALVACDSTAPDPAWPEDRATIAIVPSLATIDGGATIRLALTVRQADGTILHPVGAVWRSSDLTVATVVEGGLVRGGSPGQAAITALWQGVSGTAMVKVLPAVKNKDSDPVCLAAPDLPGKDSGDDCRR